MKRPQAIVINGLSRGGTNILWNILQSHPEVCSPIYETGELLTQHIAPFKWLEPGMAKRIAAMPITSMLRQGYLRREFHRWKLKNLESIDNNSRYEGVPYSRREVDAAVLCFKGVDSDVDLNPLLESVYRDVAHVVLVRHGHAVCNGWKRRGISPRQAGKRYASLLRRMLAASNRSSTFLLVRFEDMIADPFGTSRRLFESLHLEPSELPKLRLKSKRVLSDSGEHDPRFGSEGRKYWFAPDDITAVLDPQIDARQIASLDDQARREFDLHARDMMEELGYLSPASRSVGEGYSPHV